MKACALLYFAGLALAIPAMKGDNGNKANNANNGTAVCCKIQAQLEAGIQQNLDIQAQELQGVQALQFFLASSNATTASSSFTSTQKSVLDIQAQGIQIRESNQKLASQINSPSIDGLAIVAKAQVQEMTQVQGLKGSGDADKKTLETLVTEVQDGTKQNQQNLADATRQSCDN